MLLSYFIVQHIYSPNAHAGDQKTGAARSVAVLRWTWVSCLTDIAEKGRAREALEGCGGVEVVASKASASAVVGVVEEAGLSVTGNTERKDQRDIESSLIRAA